MSSESEVITIKPDELVPGRHASRARIVAAGLSDDDIDRLIKQAQREVEPPVGCVGVGRRERCGIRRSAQMPKFDASQTRAMLPC